MECHQPAARTGWILFVCLGRSANRSLDQVSLKIHLGCELRHASSVTEGLRLLRGASPAAVVCEIPGSCPDAWELLQSVRQKPELAAVPVVFLTPALLPAEFRALMNGGADDCVIAPFTPEDVANAVRARFKRAREILNERASPRTYDIPTLTALLWRSKQLGLTQRESEILAWISEGKANGDIATILGIGTRTVEKHVESIFSKLNVETRSAAMRQALEALGLIQGSSAN